MRTIAFIFMLITIFVCAFPQEADSIAAPATGIDTSFIGSTDSLTLTQDTTSLKQKIKKKANIFARFIKSFDEYDTTYISPNYYNYTAMMQNTNFYQVYRLQATNAAGHTQSLHIAPTPSFKIGPYIGWRWIFLGYTFDIGHPKSATKTTEFNLSLYSSMLGCDLVYIRNTGDFTIRKAEGFGENADKIAKGMEFSGLDTYTTSLNAYYVFNHRHFSYPAGFAQSTVQRKSCGSWILGFRFDKQRTKFDHTRLPNFITGSEPGAETPLIDEMKIAQLNYFNVSASGGYAYNWVFARNFLLSVSLSPSIGIKKMKGERLSGKEFWSNIKNFNFDFISRAGIVWNNTHWFAGASFVGHLYDYRRDRISLSNSINYFNVYAGFNFNRKKQYRKQ